MYKIMDGNEACATVSYNFTEVAGIYPITPASTMAELIDSFAANGKKNFFNRPVKVVEMQSEAGAIGMVHGSLQTGCLTTTYTASQGLLLMIPNMYKIAGEMLPCVINVAARSIATHALSILGDHQDIYATRMTGFACLSSSSVQEVMDLTAVPYLSTIKGRVPFVHFFDGFRTSHELQKIEVIDMEELKYLIDYDALEDFRKNALSPHHPVTRGTNQNDDIYFQLAESRNKYYNKLPDIVNHYMEEINKITGRSYAPFNYYGDPNAKRIIIAMGSVCETIKETVDIMNEMGEKVGLITVHLYRPFSTKYLLKVLPKSVEQIAVLDRTKEAGSNGEPLYLDVCKVIKEEALDIEVLGGRYGLSSKNTTPACIKAVFDFLKTEDRFTGFTVGIEDDVTHLSLPILPFKLKNNVKEFLVYGYGSDGMVSACKDLMKITGEASNAFVQGYFQYDSKKSGGVTKCHLRFSKEEIRSTYYVENPSLVVCTKDNYLKKFNVLENLQEEGIFILVTNKSKEEIFEIMPDRNKKYLQDHHIKFYVLDAYTLAEKASLGGKINYIVESVLFKLGKIIKYDYAIDKMKSYITKKFKNSSNNLVEKNISVIDSALDYLKEIDYSDVDYKRVEKRDKTLYEIIKNREGDRLKVSDLEGLFDGTVEAGLSKYEKRGISEVVPSYIKENCIECNLCSLVCPHAVIRPYLLNEEEVKNAPEVVKKKLKDSFIPGYKYAIGVSIKDCTGCGLCIDICPGKRGEKALTFKTILEQGGEEEAFKYLETVTDKNIPVNTVKGSQFKKPKFEFPGACAGCGETAYLKLITQLFGDRLVIANATGCSSIYGAEAASTPYSVPWANSLFEDNAEFGYGMRVAYDVMRERIHSIIEDNLDRVGSDYEVYENYLRDDSYDNAKALYEIVDDSNIVELIELKDYILPRSYFLVGGDGWAYDIGFSGIDHVISQNENVNILVLDTEVYSNTGGQASKSSRRGSINKFTSKGKNTAKKDLARIALSYPNAYVASISLGANPAHAIKVLLEAEKYDGPSIIIAYAPCIAQKIVEGMKSIKEEKKATAAGYFPLFHYNPDEDKFYLDSKADFSKYYEFLLGEDRYKKIKIFNEEEAEGLLSQNKSDAEERYTYYENLDKMYKEKEDEM